MPPLVAVAGERAARRFLEFFVANIRNRNTRETYSRNINAFLVWCGDEAGMALDTIEPILVPAYVEKLLRDGLSKPTVKQHLAAVRMTRHDPVARAAKVKRRRALAGVAEELPSRFTISTRSEP